ncbi:hypothetical protein [Corynebacterium sp. MNWGS58]|uniref:hypothetical protein n=1 Tax=Corynebacterium sp. 102791.4 TaxID=3104612 RepID=UPI003518C0D8
MSNNEQWGQQKTSYDWGSQPASSGYYSNDGQKRSNSLPIVVVVILVAVALAAGAGLFYWWQGSSDHDGGAGAASTNETSTSSEHSPTESSTKRSEDRETTTTRATRASEPATQVNFSGGRPGTSVTSGAFAESVYYAYMDNYRSTGKINARIDAYSPVTGQMYSMNCTGNTSSVTCRGGNNAVVHIS